ncbi:MAG: hypothetical protein WC209_18340 [Ignavibacteriaceae bacterium]
MMKTCINHPKREALSICHCCENDFCELCLDEGKEFYYCKKPECQELFKKEMPAGKLPEQIFCPGCGNEIELSENEMYNGKVHCPKCEVLIDFTVVPHSILAKENYVELFSSLNQGDIALIKSLLADAEIDYYTTGENFLSVDPLIQPAKFFISEEQVDETKELLNEFKLHVWGTSDRTDDDLSATC